MQAKEIPSDSGVQFYPTPKELVCEIVSDLDFDFVDTVLEPSAGKGDLIGEFVDIADKKGQYGSNSIDVDCIEIDSNLRAILKDKGYRVVHDNFLTYQSYKKYDLILMNPPFAEGDAHLLKAIDLQKRGGAIICILNAQTLKNPYSNKRKQLVKKLEELAAVIEYKDNRFTSSERATDVEVAVVKVNIPACEYESDIFKNIAKAKKYDGVSIQDKGELEPSDFIDALVQRYDVSMAIMRKLFDEFEGVQKYLDGPIAEDRAPVVKLSTGNSYDSYYNGVRTQNEAMCDLRYRYWKALVTNETLMSRFTSNIRDKYTNDIQRLSNYEFSKFNIQQILFELDCLLRQGVEDSIVEMFDKFTAKHTWYPECQRNIHYYGGWKTNKAHKIGKKVILPVYDMFSNYSWSPAFSVSKVAWVLTDVEKVFNYLSGDMRAEVNVYRLCEIACNNEQTKNIEFKYFTVTLYKKGTMHIVFKPSYTHIVDALNIYAAKYKGWLPPSYGNKPYEDMDEDEKAAVDAFQGEEEYRKVLENKEKYLYKVQTKGLLEQ